MRRLLRSFFVCVYLLLVSNGICAAEAMPKALQDEGGFIGVPWGAGLAQIDKVMTDQGFSGKTLLNQGNAVRYRGLFNGYPAYVVLSLWNDQFYKGTASGICQVSEVDRKGELRECFSRLEAEFTRRYGAPTDKPRWEESQIDFWTQYSDPSKKREELNLMLSMHVPEGGLTEGSLQVRFVNRRMESVFFARPVGSVTSESIKFVAYSVASGEQTGFSHEAASLVLVNRDNPALFWLRLTPQQAGLEQIITARRQAGLETGRFGNVEYVLCKAAVLPDGFIVRQQIFIDTAGEEIANWEQTDWDNSEQPGAMVAHLAQSILPNYFKIKKNNVPAGFAGIPWGSSPDTIPGAMQDETLVKVLRIYTAYVDVSSLLGDVPQVKPDWLVFDRERGLLRGVINFDGRFYEKTLQRLTDRLGNPRWERGDELYWQLADDLRIEISVMPAFGKLHGTLHVQNPQFSAYERGLFMRPKK